MRAAIFDLDGTLAETAPDLVGAANAILAEEGLPAAPFAAARPIAGRGGRALLSFGFERAGRPLDPAEIETLLPRFLAAYGARIAEETRLYDGVAETLAGLRDAGWRLGVCTNKPHGLALALLDRLGIAERFDAIRGSDVVLDPASRPVRKPDPRHLWAVIDAVGGARDRAVLIGDSVTDRDAARAAEIPVVLTRFGYSVAPVDTLAPDALIDDYAALPAHLDRLAPLDARPPAA